MPAESIRISYTQLAQTFQDILTRAGMYPAPASLCAQLFADASRDGVPSHGLNRFPLFVKTIREGIVKPNATPQLINAFGSLERWDGQSGPGPNNAHFAMTRAIEVSGLHGIGCVGLANSNHWMRAGNYGWLAADAGCIALCWTNAAPSMSPWGGTGRKMGNNPLVIAVPRANGQHVILDTAMSQFSFGKLGLFQRAGEQAPLPAGFDAQGKITTDPSAILSTGTALPIGYWKGSGLALMLDILAAAFSGGLATWQVAQGKYDRHVSQVFIAIDPAKVGVDAGAVADAVLADVQSSVPADPNKPVLYPGQRVLVTRQESMDLGVPVDQEIWEKVCAL